MSTKNLLLIMLLMGGGLGSLGSLFSPNTENNISTAGIGGGSLSTMLLPIMLFGGLSGSRNSGSSIMKVLLFMMMGIGLLPALLLGGNLLGGTSRRYYRRRRTNTSNKVAYLSGAVSALKSRS